MGGDNYQKTWRVGADAWMAQAQSMNGEIGIRDRENT